MSEIDDLYNKYGSGEATSSGTKSAIERPTSEVDTLFDKYGGNTKAKAEDEPKGEFWQGLANDPSYSGLAKRVGLSILRGGKDVLDTGAHGLQNATTYVADKVLPESIAKTIKASANESQAQDKAGRETYDKEYGENLPMSVGRVGGQIIAAAPVMPARAFQAVDAAAGALPVINAAGARVAAPIVNRLVSAAGKGALGGAEIGAATSSTNDKSLAENVGEGAITGAIGGPVIAGAGAAGKGLGRFVSEGISPAKAALAQRAEQLGINLKASQVSNSPTFKKYDQMSGMLPFSGAASQNEQQVNQFTRAISRTFGEDTHEITPQLIQGARRRIGGDIENVARNSTVRADQQLANDLHNVVNSARGTLTNQEMGPIFQNINNVIQKIDPNGNITGEVYNNLTKYNGVLSRAQKSPNPNIRNAANDIRTALDDALQRSVSPQQRQALLDARRQYKAVMTIKDLAESEADGHVSPMKLMRKVTQAPGGRLGSGELGELAEIGRAFFPVSADSGTPLGTKILEAVAPFTRSPVGAAVGTAAAMKSGIGLLNMGLSAATLPVNRIVRNMANSTSVRNDIINAARGQTHGRTERLVDRVVPYSSRIYVSPERKKSE